MNIVVPVTLIPGDGIGPEITDALVHVFEALGAPVRWERAPMGLQAFEMHGDALPAATLESFRRTRLALKGPVQTPLASGFRSPLVRLREEFQLFANLRPAQTLMPVQGRANVSFTVVRENTEGLYAAKEAYLPAGDDREGLATALAWNSRAGCERVLRFAFDYAISRNRRKVTVVHKANVLKILSGIFLNEARALHAREYANRIVMEEMIVDACAMKMAMQPEHFDVIVTTNLFGDILSDLAAGVTGGLGIAPGANIGKDAAMFEAVHGSAPDIAGKGIANPVAMLLSGALLLEHIGANATASKLRHAITTAINEDDARTPDLGGTLTTEMMTSAILRRIESI